MNASTLSATLSTLALMGAGACALGALLLSSLQARVAIIASRLALVLCALVVPLIVLNDWLLVPAAATAAQPDAAGALGPLLTHATKAAGAAMFPAMLAMLAGKRAAASLERAGRVR